MNEPLRQCLDLQDFEDLDSGNASESRIGEIFDHLSHCTVCRFVFENYQDAVDDPLTERLRKCMALSSTSRDGGLERMEAGAIDRKRKPIEAKTPRNATWLSSSLIGSMLGPNLILEEIGRGGMGIVFRARQTRLNRMVAVKVIAAGVYAHADLISRFHREAGAIARLRHTNFALLFDSADQDGLSYFTMELIEGRSLSSLLADGPLSPHRAAEIVRTVAEAIEYAHRNRILHRDLKPSNILLMSDGTPKIVDFGLAKILDDPDGRFTKTDAVLGTPSYMAPEQTNGSSVDQGPSIDVYALGAILYECLTGCPPYKGKNQYDTLRMVIEGKLVPPSELRPETPWALEAICMKCMSKLPAHRYPSAQALADDVKLWLESKTPVGIPSRTRRGLNRIQRNWVGILSIILCLVTTGAICLRDPDRQVHRFQSELAEGRPVALLGETGMPAWFRWLDGEATSKTRLDDEGVFHLDAFDTAWVELLPDVACDRYRFQIQVRHERSNLHGGVGIFAARKTYPYGRESVNSAIRLQFNDVRSQNDFPIVLDRNKNPLPRFINLPTLGPEFFKPPGETARFEAGQPYASGPAFEAAGPGKAPWRRLVLDVSPEGVAGEWDGQRFELSAVAMDEWQTRKQHESVPGRSPSLYPKAEEMKFRPRGGLGLRLYGGSAAFRSASVIPQPDH